MNFASGKSLCSVSAWAIVSQLCSTIPGLPAAAASGPSSAKNSALHAASGAASKSRRKAEHASSRTAGSTWRKSPRRLRRCRARPRHQRPRSLLTKLSGDVRPASRSGNPPGSTWKRTSLLTLSSLEWRPSSRATTWVPLRPVPPTKTIGRSLFAGSGSGCAPSFVVR